MHINGLSWIEWGRESELLSWSENDEVKVRILFSFIQRHTHRMRMREIM